MTLPVKTAEAHLLASRKAGDTSTVIQISDTVSIGGALFVLIAGPCSVESEDQIMETARAVKSSGAHILRGGVFKPRTNPYSFQGIGKKGLWFLQRAGSEAGMPVITEVMDFRDIPVVADMADIVQVGARNAQNYPLLKELGKINKPVLLKRGMMMTIEELLLSAEYILAGGNADVILCERGIRTFEPLTRNTLDISAVPILKQKTHLPVIVDPSHASGRWELVEPLSLAAAGAGADGLLIEVHPVPEEALSDGIQSLKPERFRCLAEKLRNVLPVLGRKL